MYQIVRIVKQYRITPFKSLICSTALSGGIYGFYRGNIEANKLCLNKRNVELLYVVGEAVQYACVVWSYTMCYSLFGGLYVVVSPILYPYMIQRFANDLLSKDVPQTNEN